MNSKDSKSIEYSETLEKQTPANNTIYKWRNMYNKKKKLLL